MNTSPLCHAMSILVPVPMLLGSLYISKHMHNLPFFMPQKIERLVNILLPEPIYTSKHGPTTFPDFIPKNRNEINKNVKITILSMHDPQSHELESGMFTKCLKKQKQILFLLKTYYLVSATFYPFRYRKLLVH